MHVLHSSEIIYGAFQVVQWQRLVNTGDETVMNLVPGPRTFPEEGKDIPFHYSCLGNPWTEEPGGLWLRGSQKSDMIEHVYTFIERLLNGRVWGDGLKAMATIEMNQTNGKMT